MLLIAPVVVFVLFVGGVFAMTVLRRRRVFEPIERAPMVFTKIRPLREEHEVREVARHASEQAHSVVREAERRAAHFRELSPSCAFGWKVDSVNGSRGLS